MILAWYWKFVYSGRRLKYLKLKGQHLVFLLRLPLCAALPKIIRISCWEEDSKRFVNREGFCVLVSSSLDFSMCALALWFLYYIIYTGNSRLDFSLRWNYLSLIACLFTWMVRLGSVAHTVDRHLVPFKSLLLNCTWPQEAASAECRSSTDPCQLCAGLLDAFWRS